MPESVVSDCIHREAQALYKLAALLELVLDNGHAACVFRRFGRLRWQIFVGDPEGPLQEMTSYGFAEAHELDAIRRQTVDGLNVLVINGEMYRFTRSDRSISHAPGTVFVPG
jgi:hypothetical protein